MDAEAIEKIIKEEAFISLISDDYIQDEETFYYRTIASRFIDNRVLHELVESSPIIASYDRFPRLEEIQKEALILESKPCFSSTFVRFLVAALQPGIRPYVKSINKEINESGISVLNVSCFSFFFYF